MNTSGAKRDYMLKARHGQCTRGSFEPARVADKQEAPKASPAHVSGPRGFLFVALTVDLRSRR
jgi:hypothetical protein